MQEPLSPPPRWRDEATRFGRIPWVGAMAPWPFERLFHQHYEVLREVCHDVAGPGFAVFAVYANHLLADAVTLVPDGPRSVAVVGRHSRAHLHLAHDPSVALRHLVLRARRDPGRDAQGLTLRVLDLNTGQGFGVDGGGDGGVEGGVAGGGVCEAIVVQGDACVTLGSYAVLILQLDGQAWPADAAEAWSRRPRGPLCDARPPDAARGKLPQRGLPDGGHDGSGITIVSGPVPLGTPPSGTPSCVSGPVARGTPRPSGPSSCVATLRPMGRLGNAIFGVDRGHLQRGLLMGRYGRCDLELRELWHSDAVSRVHALLIQEAEGVLAVDLASTNGTWVDDRPQPVAVLGEQAVIELGRGNLLRWRERRGGREGPRRDE